MAHSGVLLFDGAMGTWYADRFGQDMPCEWALLRHPERIAAIHNEYLLAGANAIITDTFRADTRALGSDHDTLLRLIDAAWRVAVDAAGEEKPVWAGFGPPTVDTNLAHDEEASFEQSVWDETALKIDRFLDRGARRFLFETFEDDALPLRACAYIKKVCPDATTLVSFAVSPDGTTRSGRMGQALYLAACRSPFVDIAGFNCVSGPTHLLRFVHSLPEREKGTGKPLSIQPNAGYPVLDDGRTVYRNNPDYFADTMMGALEKGVAVLGGCCGTTPAHIAALASRLRTRTGGFTAQVPTLPTQPAGIVLQPSVIKPARNRFAELLRTGRPVLLTELDPPAGADPDMVTAFASAYRDAGAHIVTVADNPLGAPRADAGITAARIRRECGIDAMPHIACRDRNLLGIRSQLIALHNEGIRNLLAVTGDPVPADLAADVRGVFHLNAIQLIEYIMTLNSGLFDGDGFVVGGAVNLGATRFDVELERAARKVRAGAAFLITQPVFGEDGLHRLEVLREASLGVPVIAGILPVVSHRNAMFLNNEVHGIRIPPPMLQAFEGLTKEDASALGVRFALDTLRAATEMVDGFHLMTPFRRTGMVAEILQEYLADRRPDKGV